MYPLHTHNIRTDLNAIYFLIRAKVSKKIETFNIFKYEKKRATFTPPIDIIEIKNKEAF